MQLINLLFIYYLSKIGLCSCAGFLEHRGQMSSSHLPGLPSTPPAPTCLFCLQWSPAYLTGLLYPAAHQAVLSLTWISSIASTFSLLQQTHLTAKQSGKSQELLMDLGWVLSLGKGRPKSSPTKQYITIWKHARFKWLPEDFSSMGGG